MADALLVDPLNRSIVLHDHTWFGHVVKRHPDMRRLRPLAEQAVRQPARICFSTSDADCRIYSGAGPSSGIMVAVVADVARGHVLTAYRAARTKGVVEW